MVPLGDEIACIYTEKSSDDSGYSGSILYLDPEYKIKSCIKSCSNEFLLVVLLLCFFYYNIHESSSSNENLEYLQQV